MTPDLTPVERLAVLADPTRHAVLELLREGPRRVGELAARLPVSGPAVSQHLKVLQRAQVVRDEWRGTSHYFSLDPKGFDALRRYAEGMWQDALNAFAAYVNERTRPPAGKPGRGTGKGTRR
jgi:DNA-binding transcriptional ArsR family regulator